MTETFPGLVVAADWSVNPAKRWMTRAARDSAGRYLIFPPEPVGHVPTLLPRLTAQAGTAGLFLGVDFPIGWPRKYASQLPFPHFLRALPELGTGDWEHFFTRAHQPSLHQPFFPPPELTREKGNYRAQLVTGLGLQQTQDLLRRCDRKTSDRPAAESLFFTCGAKQVGAGAILGWSDLLIPHLPAIQLWPFAGPLPDLWQPAGAVVAEVYPAEAYHRFGIRFGAGVGRKGNRADRQRALLTVRTVIESWPEIALTDAAISWWEMGFLTDDDFDATLGLLLMLAVITGRVSADIPEDDPAIRRHEGWILGLAADAIAL